MTTTNDLITAMAERADSLRQLAVLMVNADLPQKEYLEYRAEQLYAAAACLELWIDGLLETETAP